MNSLALPRPLAPQALPAARPYVFTPRVAASRSPRFVVTPYNCWMKPGESIATNWKVYT